MDILTRLFAVEKAKICFVVIADVVFFYFDTSYQFENIEK